ncbi:hypothetical protein ENSA5_11840 [Enhygromyxa salina]|uniref:Uncharacterized protein n=2 Tax=Enhygromyxa salina TaxID=215803 RepID=A0A2S9YG28_9BACT|nr:hypothetical protein ENSA5_11840 [Enhygromyxa salina]
MWWSYIPTLPPKFFESLKEVDGPTKITPEDVDALTREELRSLRSALQNYVEHRKCARQAEAMYYYHEKLLTDVVVPRVERTDNLEAAPDRLDDGIFHVVEKLALGKVERAILMQCAPYIHRRMKEIVAGAPLAPASDSEIEQVGYFGSAAVESVDGMTMAEVKSKQKAGILRAEFRRNHMTNAAVQIIRGIPNTANVHVDWKHPGLERGGSPGDMMSILRTIKDEMRVGLAVVKRIRNLLGTSAAEGVEKPAMQLNDYISSLQQTDGTLYTVDYERGSESANVDYARSVELATLREIWPARGSAASEE